MGSAAWTFARTASCAQLSLKWLVVMCALAETRSSPLSKVADVALHLPRPVGSAVMARLFQKQTGCCHTVTCRPTIHASIPTRVSPAASGSRHRRHLLRPVFAASTKIVAFASSS